MVHVRRGRDLTRRRAIEPLLRKDRKRRAENQLTRLVVRAGGSNPRFERAVPRCSPFCAPLRSCRASNRGAGRSSPLNKHEGDSTLYAMHCNALQSNSTRGVRASTSKYRAGLRRKRAIRVVRASELDGGPDETRTRNFWRDRPVL